MLLPAVAAFAFVVIVPSVQGALYAFTDWNGLTDQLNFVGLENFARAFQEGDAWRALGNTLVLAAVVMIAQNSLGLLLALGLNTAVKSRFVLRVVFFTPVILTPLVAGYIWSYLLTPRGAVNTALEYVGLGELRQDWLGDPAWALYSVSLAIVWQFTGYSMIIFLAGLQGIPREVIEAAVVDGAGPVRRFLSITFPFLRQALAINLLLSVISGLSQFDQVWVMTGGGPLGATETISIAIFREGFQLGDYPYGTALSVLLALMVALIAVAQYRLTSSRADG
ncbi:MAG: sugar ABC transporter permease [Microbacteriaceae bacterium]|nr:sugar ABC transporter permease [Microbacteriaceae bacterium]